MKDLVVYETHVRGFTRRPGARKLCRSYRKVSKMRNPDSKLSDWDATAGTFLGVQ